MLKFIWGVILMAISILIIPSYVIGFMLMHVFNIIVWDGLLIEAMTFSFLLIVAVIFAVFGFIVSLKTIF